MHRILPTVAAFAVGALLAACGPAPTAGPDPASTAASAAALDSALQKLAAAEATGQPEAAVIYAREIMQEHPGSAAAHSIAARLPELQQAAAAAREAERLSDLWTYHAIAAGDGTQFSAYLFGQSATHDAPGLRLVLRRHPEWGQNSYLLLGDGAVFACTGTCTIELGFDGEPLRPVEASRAEDADPPAVFIEDDRLMFERTERATTLHIRLPLQDGRTIDYMFELGGYAPARMLPAGSTDETGR